MSSSPIFPVMGLGAVYFLALGPMLLVSGNFFDDWAWRDLPGTWHLLHELGRPFLYESLVLVRGLDGLAFPWVGGGAILAFVAGLAAWVFIWRALRSVPGLSDGACFWIVALSMAAPLNFSRALWCNVYYQIAFLLFAMAMWCASCAASKPGLRLAGGGLLIAACQVESFYFASFALILFPLSQSSDWRSGPWRQRLERLVRLALRHGEFFAIPLLCYGLRAVFFKPSGLYESYNSLSLGGLVKAIPFSLGSTLDVLYFSLAGAALFPHQAIGGFHLIMLCAAMAAMVVARLAPDAVMASAEPSRRGAVLGVLLLAFLLFPYAAVKGWLTPFSNWGDRDFLTAPLAVGLALYFGLCACVRPQAQRIALAVLLAAAMAGSAMGYLALARDGQINQAVVMALRAHPELARHTRFSYWEDAPGLWLSRGMRPYEWEGLLAQAFGGEGRQAIPRHLLGPDPQEEFRRQAGLRSHLPYLQDFPLADAPIQVLSIAWAARLSVADLLRLHVLRIRDERAYERELAGFVRLCVQPLE